MPTVALTTLGCKVNQAEGDRILADLDVLGFSTVPFDEQADVYVVNSCTVTSEADHKSRRLVRAALRSNPAALVILAGCYASEAARRDVSLPPNVHLVSGDHKEELAGIIAERFGLDTDRSATESWKERPLPVRTRAIVKVQDGCDNFCTYCVVPFVRGAPYSRPAGDVLDEIEWLTRGGVREVVLTGVNLGRYFSDGLRLDGLLGRILDTGIGRVRLSSIEPEEFSDALVAAVGGSERVCPHLHVPLQSGSDAVLARMGRRYRSADYLELIRRLRDVRPDLALTTDVMVGFPAETEADVEVTVKLLERVEPLKLHVFKYSPRPRTVAEGFGDQIDPRVKAARARRIAALDERLSGRFVAGLVGNELDVLVESVSDGQATGVAANYVRCFFKGEDRFRGSIIRVRATRRSGRALHAEVVGKT